MPVIANWMCALGLAVQVLGGGKEPACPNVRATGVDSAYTDVGPLTKCGPPLSGVGAGGSFQPTCPKQRLLVPAHNECQGEPSEGTRCAPAGDLPVQLLDCACSPTVQLSGGWVATGCTCAPNSNVGTIENFTTKAC
jgi:hypothetical protein